MFSRILASALVIGAVWGAVWLPPAASASSGVWSRTRKDGVVEFTNVPKSPASGSWRNVKPATKGEPAPAERAPASESAAPPSPARTNTVWTRQSRDGTIEFTNVSPVGANWKVLFRTGPGKAAALRGASDLVPPRDGSSKRFSRYDQHIRDQQAFYGIPEALIRAVIKTESDFDPLVVSSAGACGLMQLMPGTARQMGVTDVWDPRQNIMGGARYLQVLAKRFCRTPLPSPTGAHGLTCSPDELVKIIAGYHAGPGAVEKYRGMPPYETTRYYVTTVLNRFEQYRRQSAVGEVAAR